MLDNIKWLGHGSYLIQGNLNIFIDPWRVIRSSHHADIILITHDHYDHCSIADIEKIRTENTTIISNDKVAKMIPDVTIIRPWQSIAFDRISIKAIPAYAPDGIQHPKEDGGLGYVISINFYDIYYAGDTQIIPEMARIHPDIVILPIDGKETLTADDAIKVVEELSPRYVFPANWGNKGEGATTQDAQSFKQKVGGKARVIIPDLYRE